MPKSEKAGCLTGIVLVIAIVIGLEIADCHQTTFEKCVEERLIASDADTYETMIGTHYAPEVRRRIENFCDFIIENDYYTPPPD